MTTKVQTVIYNEVADERDFINDYYEINQVLFTSNIFVGTEVELSDKLILGVEPNVKFNINEFRLYFGDVEIKSRPEVGITLRLRTKEALGKGKG